MININYSDYRNQRKPQPINPTPHSKFGQSRYANFCSHRSLVHAKSMSRKNEAAQRDGAEMGKLPHKQDIPPDIRNPKASVHDASAAKGSSPCFSHGASFTSRTIPDRSDHLSGLLEFEALVKTHLTTAHCRFAKPVETSSDHYEEQELTLSHLFFRSDA